MAVQPLLHSWSRGIGPVWLLWPPFWAGLTRRPCLFHALGAVFLTALTVCVITLLSQFGACGQAQGPVTESPVREPPRPEKVAVLIRYQILTERDQRILQYRAFSRYLEGIEFVDDRTDPEERAADALDPTSFRLQGTIPSAQVLKILHHPAVQSLLIMPVGFSFIDDPDSILPVRIVLRSGLTPRNQQLLYRQVLERLQLFGFQEAIGYDTRDYTQIKGRLPKRHLLALWRDFRDEPSGWFWNSTLRRELPRPLADASPIRWVEVLPAGEAGQRLPVGTVGELESRWTPALRARLADAATAGQPLRVEAVFSRPMEDELPALQELLESTYGGTKTPKADTLRLSSVSVEGVVGNVATLYFQQASDLKHCTSILPHLLFLRLPQEPTVTLTRLVRGEAAVPLERLLEQLGVRLLHQKGYQGQGTRIVVLVTDLDGVAEQIGKTLPATTRWIDLTAELNPQVQPLPVEGKDRSGLALAQAVAAVAPAAELILVRLDPTALFQVAEVVRWLQQPDYLSPALRLRGRELERQLQRALEQKQQAIQKRQQLLQNPESPEMLRQQVQEVQAAVQAAETLLREVTARYERYQNLRQDLARFLQDVTVVIHPWAWDAGYPLDGYSPLSRQLEGVLSWSLPQRIVRPAVHTKGMRPSRPRPPVWLQAASAMEGNVWVGLLRDDNDNGLLDYTHPSDPLPADQWNREMNFLAWQTADGTVLPELPQGTAFRCTLQWREPLDPNFPDWSRPLYALNMHLWRQLDPSGQKQASDEMTEVARSVGGPYPIQVADGTVVYEQILEVTITTAGRYALVISLGQREKPPIGALQRQVEIVTRLFVETTASGPGGAGRCVWRSFASVVAGVGLPGDIPETITIGAETPWQLRAAGPTIPLLRKPDYLMPPVVSMGAQSWRGTAMGTAVSGGLAALLLQAGLTDPNPFRVAGARSESVLRLPESFFQRLPPAAPPPRR
ncbi:MAG: hypothetical protein NZU63_01235 [Gemmataceae bacterium]|nr:hypothetical protein [Gemmataceae bacterium]MDW8242316.1 hypothetical protein [Thermogemmata sp.]